MSFTMPNTITNGQTRDARPVQANFDAITAALNNDFVRADGSVAMTGTLELSGSPVSTNHAATKGYVDTASTSAIPVGVILDYGGDVAPGGFELCQGQLVNKADNPTLWALFGDKYGTSTATQFYLPDLRERFIVGKGAATWADVLGETGGSKDAIVVAHSHSVSLSGTVGSGGTHSHTYSKPTSNNSAVLGGGAFYNNVTSDSTGSSGSHTHSFSGSGSASSAGSSGTDKNLPPYIVMNKIVRLG